MDVDQLCNSGTLEPVAVVAERVTGSRPSPPTIYRWCRKGLAGGKVRLSSVLHGGCWRTTDAAFREFLTDQTNRKEEAQGGAVLVVDDSDEAFRRAGLL